MWRKREEPKQPQPNSVPAAPPVQTPPTAVRPETAGQGAAPPAAQAIPAPAPVSAPAAKPVERSSSVISKGVAIHGEITGSEDLQVDGEIRGTLKMAGARVTVTPEGRAAATIEAREVVIRGNISGNIRATERVVVGSSGVWQGDAIAPRLMIEEGAIIHGKFEVAQPREEQRSGKSAGHSNREELVTTRAGAN